MELEWVDGMGMGRWYGMEWEDGVGIGSWYGKIE